MRKLYRQGMPWDPPRNAEPRERPADGWPVRVVEECRCPSGIKAFCGELGFHENNPRGLAQCLFEGWPEWWSGGYGSAYIEGEGWYAFMHNLSGAPDVTLHETLDEAKAHQEQFFRDIGRYQPVRHIVVDLTAARDMDGDFV